MRFTIGLLALATVASGLTAQSNEFAVFAGDINATSRSGVPGPSHGDILQQYIHTNGADAGDFCGIGQTANPAGGNLAGFALILQDQNAATQENYRFVMVKEDAATAGQPDPAATGFIIQSANLQSPVGTGVTAWRITANFQNAQNVIPATSTIFAGYTLQDNAAWTADGLSIQMGSYRDLTGNFPQRGENPRPGAPNVTWTVTRTTFGAAGTVNNQVSARTHAVFLLTEGDVLNVGADVPTARRRTAGTQQPDYGMAGLYPEVGFQPNGDGLTWRIKSGAGSLVLLYSGNRVTPPLSFPFLKGALCLDPATFGQAAAGVANGTQDTTIAPSFTASGSINGLANGGRLLWQVIRVGGAGLCASNGTGTLF